MAAPAVIADRRLAAVARARVRLDDVATSPKRRRALVECRHLTDDRSAPIKRRRLDEPLSRTQSADTPWNLPSMCLYDEYTLSTTPPSPNSVDACARAKKARPTADEPSSHALHELEKFRSTLVAVPRHIDDAVRTISNNEMRRFRVRTLIEESGGDGQHRPAATDGPCVDSAQCFVCVESTLQRVVDRRADGEHRLCAVARGDLCAECAARHLAQSSRCPVCRQSWHVDAVRVVECRVRE